MDPLSAPFPIELLNYFQAEQEDVYKIGLKNIFKESETVRDSFISWADNHHWIIEKAHPLCEAERIAKAIKFKNKTSSTERLDVDPYRDNHIASAIETLSKPAIDNFSLNNVLTAIVLYELEFIDKDLLVKLFNEKVKGEDQISDLLKTLSKEKYANGANLLCCGDIFEASIPFLETLTTSTLIKCLSIKDDRGYTPLFYKSILKMALPLLNQHNCLIRLLTIQNNNGDTPLHFVDIGELAIPFLEKCKLTEVADLFAIQDNNGNTPLHTFEIADASISILRKMKSNMILRLLSIQNNQGDTPMHFVDIADLAIPLLEKLNASELEYLTSIKNLDNESPCNPIYSLNKAFPLFNKVLVKKLEEVVNIEKDKENPLLINAEIPKNFYPYNIHKLTMELFEMHNSKQA